MLTLPCRPTSAPLPGLLCCIYAQFCYDLLLSQKMWLWVRHLWTHHIYRFLHPGQLIFFKTRPKPAYGRQGLDWDRWARIQFSQVHFGAKLDSTDLLWCKNVTSPTGGSNRPFRCLEEGGRALPKFLAPFQNVSKKHSGYDLLLNKYSGGFREITILM